MRVACIEYAAKVSVGLVDVANGNCFSYREAFASGNYLTVKNLLSLV